MNRRYTYQNRHVPKTNTAIRKLPSPNYSNMSGRELKDWKIIHTEAKHATTEEKKLEFYRYIKYLSTNFPCQKCRRHIKTYLVDNILPRTYDNKEIYLWAWKFHNSVNRRLRKPIMSLDDVLKMYETL